MTHWVAQLASSCVRSIGNLELMLNPIGRLVLQSARTPGGSVLHVFGVEPGDSGVGAGRGQEAVPMRQAETLAEFRGEVEDDGSRSFEACIELRLCAVPCCWLESAAASKGNRFKRWVMIAVHAKWKDGRVVVEGAVDWPDGCELEVRPVSVNGSDDDVQSNDPDAIARWIAEFQAIPPLQMTDEELAEWQAARQAQRELELKTFDQRADRIQQALP